MDQFVAWGVNWVVVLVVTFCAVMFGIAFGYVSGKIAESATLDFTLFFLFGFFLEPVGLLIALVARFFEIRNIRERSKILTYGVEAPSYYQPVYLQETHQLMEPVSQFPTAASDRRHEMLVGMGTCPYCEADVSKTMESCWKCGEIVSMAHSMAQGE
jgi:hypothetical protein